MNIFILSLSVVECAMFHCDQHVIKMILESAQLLCTVVLMAGGKAGYRVVLPKHKCTLWTLASLANWKWLRDLAYALNEEFKFRYDRKDDHQSIAVIKELLEPNIPDVGITEFHQAMPEQFKNHDPVVAYRNYYAGAKFQFATWKKRGIPDWYVALRLNLGGDAVKEVQMLQDPKYLREKRKKAKEEKIMKKMKKEMAEKKKLEKKKGLRHEGSSKEIILNDRLDSVHSLKLNHFEGIMKSLKNENTLHCGIRLNTLENSDGQNYTGVKTRNMIRQLRKQPEKSND